jgi:hypothetical protein
VNAARDEIVVLSVVRGARDRESQTISRLN